MAMLIPLYWVVDTSGDIAICTSEELASCAVDPIAGHRIVCVLVVPIGTRCRSEKCEEFAVRLLCALDPAPPCTTTLSSIPLYPLWELWGNFVQKLFDD